MLPPNIVFVIVNIDSYLKESKVTEEISVVIFIRDFCSLLLLTWEDPH